MVTFYEMVTGVTAQWLAPVFAELVTPGAVLAIGSVETVPLWQENIAESGANRTVVLEFEVDDIDTEYARLKDSVPLVHEIKTMPWGNKTFQFRDPEGSAVSLFMPATEEAKRRSQNDDRNREMRCASADEAITRVRLKMPLTLGDAQAPRAAGKRAGGKRP
jgi:hypothetical protein